MSETQLNSTEVSLQPWVEDALVNLHARKKVPMNSNFTPWTIEEDRLLLHSYQNGAKIKANHPGGRARMQWADEKAVEAPLNAAKRFLQRIFVYRPGSRPSAEACLGQPFLARWSGG